MSVLQRLASHFLIIRYVIRLVVDWLAKVVHVDYLDRLNLLHVHYRLMARQRL